VNELRKQRRVQREKCNRAGQKKKNPEKEQRKSMEGCISEIRVMIHFKMK
jgi:hypothetical protein